MQRGAPALQGPVLLPAGAEKPRKQKLLAAKVRGVGFRASLLGAKSEEIIKKHQIVLCQRTEGSGVEYCSGCREDSVGLCLLGTPLGSQCSPRLRHSHLLLLGSPLETLMQKRVLQHPARAGEAVPWGGGGEHSGRPTPAATQLLCSCPKARLLPGDAEANRRANFKDRWLTSKPSCPHHLGDDPIMSSARGRSATQPASAPWHSKA